MNKIITAAIFSFLLLFIMQGLFAAEYNADANLLPEDNFALLQPLPESLAYKNITLGEDQRLEEIKENVNNSLFPSEEKRKAIFNELVSRSKSGKMQKNTVDVLMLRDSEGVPYTAGMLHYISVGKDAITLAYVMGENNQEKDITEKLKPLWVEAEKYNFLLYKTKPYLATYAIDNIVAVRPSSGGDIEEPGQVLILYRGFRVSDDLFGESMSIEKINDVLHSLISTRNSILGFESKNGWRKFVPYRDKPAKADAGDSAKVGDDQNPVGVGSSPSQK